MRKTLSQIETHATATRHPREVRAIMESAGATIIAMQVKGAWPSGYRSCMPEVKREFSDLIGAAKENKISMPRPSLRAMSELDLAMDWLSHLGFYCRDKNMSYVARAVSIGMLHHPLSGRRLYSWRAVAEKMHCSKNTAQAWYDDGIEIIARRFAK